MLKFSFVEVGLFLVLVPFLLFLFLFVSWFLLFYPSVFSAWLFFLPRLFPLLPCGVLTPCHVVERHPFGVCCGSPNCAVSSAALVRSAWLPLHLCPLSRPEWLVFCATCCRQRYWARYMRHGTKDFGPVWEFCPFTPCGLPLSLPLSS